MTSRTRRTVTAFACSAGIVAIAGMLALGQNTDTKKTPPTGRQATPPAGAPAMPPGMPEMTPQQMQDMQACEEAGKTGPMHQWLAKQAGTWSGKNKFWMSPDQPAPMESTCVYTVTPVMGGRFIKSECTGDMMGTPFEGLAFTGFDNVSQKFVGTWIDNCGTGIMNGTGDLSSDQKTLNFNYTMNCPVQKKPVAMREVVKYPNDKTMVMEMWCTDPHSKKEYKCMQIDFTKAN